jgi:tripartite-type tricarboxylate transporter receptor subunit TctC
MGGVDFVRIPYKGSGPAVNDLLSGQVQMMNEIVVLPHVKAGKLKLLNINFPTRHPDFPEVPTLRAHPKITESGVGYFVDAGFPRRRWAG